MAIHLSPSRPVQCDKFVHKILACLLRVGGIAGEITEAEFGYWRGGNFGLEEIHFVEE